MIIDNNFLSNENVDEIESVLLSENFPWFLTPSLVVDNPELFTVKNIKTAKGYQFNHIFYNSGVPTSEYNNFALSIFESFARKHDIRFRSILRAKANLTTKNSCEEGFVPHIDHPFEHHVFLYYVNDSDGDTVFFDKKWKKSGEIVELFEDSRMSPSKGTALFFDGRTYHSPLPPQNSDYRAVINISLVV